MTVDLGRAYAMLVKFNLLNHFINMSTLKYDWYSFIIY